MAAAAAGPARGFWGRLRDSRLGRWTRALLQDYSSSLRDAASSARRRPGLSSAALLALGLGATLASTVPDLDSLESALVAAGGTLGQLPPSSRSPRSERHVLRLLRLRERGRIRVRNFGFFSVATSEPHGSDPALYSARCPHLRPRVWEPGELLDLGFLGSWWVLREALRDCDVNEEEFGHLPERLRGMERGQLRSERNERLHRERLRPAGLRPRVREPGELLDLGFLGSWWVLREALRDCDVNEEEFGHLPERLRGMERGQLRSERNERLHRERLRPAGVGGEGGEGGNGGK